MENQEKPLLNCCRNHTAVGGYYLLGGKFNLSAADAGSGIDGINPASKYSEDRQFLDLDGSEVQQLLQNDDFQKLIQDDDFAS
jgi:hypothetical protein